MKRNHPRRCRHLAAAVALLVVATSCSLVADDGPALTLGAIYPLSGRQGPGGIDEERGARLAVELANRQGGVHGRRIRLNVVDVDTGSVTEL